MKHHPFPPGTLGRREKGEVRLEASTRHPKGWQDLVYGLGQPASAVAPLRAQSRAGAGELGRGGLALVGELTQIQVGGIEQVELVRGAIPCSEHVGERGPVLLGEPEQHIATLLQPRESAGVTLDPRGVLAGRACSSASRRSRSRSRACASRTATRSTSASL